MITDTALALPTALEGITAEWMTRALATRRPGVVVSRCEVIDTIFGTSTKIRVALDYASHGEGPPLPERMIVKGGFEEHSARMAAMFTAEVRFYRDILPFTTLRTPECYFAGTQPAGHPGSYQGIVIMEDLALRGVRFCSGLVPETHDEVSRRLRSLAVHHARTWNSPEFAPGGRWDWVRSRFTTDSKAYADRYLQPEVWAHYMSSPRGAAVSVTLHDREWMGHALARLGEIEARSDLCIIHGDTHLGNLYIEPDGTPGFFDMQSARANWALEVAYHVGVSVDVADRRRWEGGLLETYLAELRANGVAAPSFDEAWELYVRSLAYGYFIFAINEVHFQTEAVNTANCARIAAAMIDHDTKRLLS